MNMAVFARKASGLTREASLFDAFAFGFMNNGLGIGLSLTFNSSIDHSWKEAYIWVKYKLITDTSL